MNFAVKREMLAFAMCTIVLPASYVQYGSVNNVSIAVNVLLVHAAMPNFLFLFGDLLLDNFQF